MSSPTGTEHDPRSEEGPSSSTPRASVTADPSEASSSQAGGFPLLDQRGADIEREQHLKDVVQTRRALGFSILLWHAYLPLDAAAARWLGAPPFTFFLEVRLGAALLFLAPWLRMYLKPVPSPAALTAFDILDYSLASAALAALCVPFGGLESPYCMGEVMVLIGASVTRFYPWRTGLWRYGVPALSFVTVMLASARVSPLVRAQLSSPRSLATFGVYLAFLATTWAFSTVGGHLVWALRRQVFESRSVGRYRLKRRLGAGSMGEVWLAHHAALRRDVAVKVLLPGRAVDGAALARFEREVRATSDLTHPNTVRVFDYGSTEDGLWFYAMEYVEGEDLARKVAREGPLSPARAVRIVSQAARALSEAHGRGIIHRDVKPENILVSFVAAEGDFVKVVDFGIAKFAGEGESTLTRAGAVLGTPAYMSPEAITGKPVDARSDVYGLGSVLYFLLTGRPPFDAATLPELMHSHVNEPPQLPPNATQPLSRELEAVVYTALAKSPEARFADAAAFHAALSACPEAKGSADCSADHT